MNILKPGFDFNEKYAAGKFLRHCGTANMQNYRVDMHAVINKNTDEIDTSQVMLFVIRVESHHIIPKDSNTDELAMCIISINTYNKISDNPYDNRIEMIEAAKICGVDFYDCEN